MSYSLLFDRKLMDRLEKVRQTAVHMLKPSTNVRCITGGISTKFSKGEASCLENCVDRFLDSSLYIVRQIEAQRNQSH